MLIRSLKTFETIQNDNDFDKRFNKAKLYMQYLSDQGCAKPISQNSIAPTISKKGTGEKTTGMHAKSILIPRDLEKLIRTGDNRQLDMTQLKKIR